MLAQITAVALMIGAIGTAAGAMFVMVRVLIKAPHVVQVWLDDRAAARVKAMKQDAAMVELLTMIPNLRTALEQLNPNSGKSMYDLVHQNDATLSELRTWVRGHRGEHTDIDELLNQIAPEIVNQLVEPLAEKVVEHVEAAGTQTDPSAD